MIDQNWLIRMARWARNPPSWGQVKLVVGVIAICFAIWGFELAFGWPEWLRVQRIKP